MAADDTLVERALLTSGPATVPDIVSNVFKTSSVGAINTAIGDTFYGINHRQQPLAIPINKDYFGFTFFTRPDLNFSTANLRTVRQFSSLLTKESMSIQRIIRCLLSPRLAHIKPATTSPFVDAGQAFIPVLTNHLLSMSGWPDIDAPTYTSPDGIYKEAYSMIDGVTQNYTTYDITANFRNIPGDPITLLFMSWLHYCSRTYLGEMVPWPDKIVENEYDYNTRIYRLVMDPSKRFVQKIAATIAFPTTCPIGAAFNFDAEKPLNQGLDQISVTFRCMGAEYQDYILMDEFNRATEEFTPTMGDAHRNAHYIAVPYHLLGLFNNSGYPRINMATRELEWFVPRDEFAAKQNMFSGWTENQGRR